MNMSRRELVDVEARSETAWLTIDRPERLNALSVKPMGGLPDACVRSRVTTCAHGPVEPRVLRAAAGSARHRGRPAAVQVGTRHHSDGDLVIVRGALEGGAPRRASSSSSAPVSRCPLRRHSAAR